MQSIFKKSKNDNQHNQQDIGNWCISEDENKEIDPFLLIKGEGIDIFWDIWRLRLVQHFFPKFVDSSCK